MQSQVEVLPAIGTSPEIILAPWGVGAEHRETFACWIDCQRKWLDSLERRSGKTNTRKAYSRDVADFFQTFVNMNLQPWQVTKPFVHEWVQHMEHRGLAKSTINRRMAAMSSLYQFAAEDYVIPSTGDPLWDSANPFKGRTLRTKVSPYGRAKYPSSDEVKAILAAIEPTTITGLRNICILGGIFITTRRVSEWLNLKWGDIHEGQDGYWFEYRYKGGDTKRQSMPSDLHQYIVRYLQQSGRYPLEEDDYVFVATTDVARRITIQGDSVVPDDYDPAGQPLSASYVNHLLKALGVPLGIDQAKLHAHALRHAGARCRKEHGADIWELKDILGHASIAITQVYTDTVLTEPQDRLGDQLIADVLPRQLKFLLRDK